MRRRHSLRTHPMGSAPILASGQGILSFVMFGVPAGIIGVICFISTAVLAFKRDHKTAGQFGNLG